MLRIVTPLYIALLAATAPGEPAFRPALPGYHFEFPRDHGAHPGFRTEWWYYTGNLDAEGGAQFGYELTVFRTELAPAGAGIDSPLAAREILLGHFAISDITGRRHQSWERIGRAGFGQASASTEQLDIRLGAWRATMDDDEVMHLVARDGDNAIDLRLAPAKPLVIHGHDGVHQKSHLPGQASHYYSYTRLATTGTITWRGRAHAVEGLSWMDHEFGSKWLSDEQVGWDWFALQLESGEDIMVYQLREKGGGVSPQTTGSWVGVEGERREIAGKDFTLEVLRTWTSPDSGAVYPIEWRLTFPGWDGDLHVTPAFESQEMLTKSTAGTVYWEGAVRIEGTWGGQPARGRGYVELVGYAEAFGLL